MTIAIPLSDNAASIDKGMRRRMLFDRLFQQAMTAGGIGVIVAVSAIFFYLASIVIPMFVPPAIESQARFATPGPADQTTAAISGEEQREVGVRIGSKGGITFFNFATGELISQVSVKVPEGAQITAFDIGERATYSLGYGLSNGSVLVAKQGFTVTFPAGKRLISPEVSYPLGEAPIQVDPRGLPIRQVSIQQSDDGSTVAALTQDGRLLVSAVKVTTNLMTGEAKSELEQASIDNPPADIRRLMVESKQGDLYVLHGERSITRYSLLDRSAPRRVETVEVAEKGQRVTAMTILSGGFSLIVGTDKGTLDQWFLVRQDGNNFALTHIRSFDSMAAEVTALAPEFQRKGFVAGDKRGHLGSYFATSGRLLFNEKISDKPITSIGIPPRGNGYMAQDAADQFFTAKVHNEYPEVSFSALWQKVWYESYERPDYVWQSSAGHSDFEPKYSLMPLTYGTIKAASYAMVVAIPLAILGAIFTAYFMTPRMRTTVKPAIEVMAALPTVVIGFLAGLWLAPLVENNLAGVLMSLLLMPLGIVAVSYAWHLLPSDFKTRVGDGWEAAILMPVVAILIWLFFQLGHPIEAAFFGGDMPNWLSNTLGIKYEQRNSLVVGIAMGFAVTPIIFSIAEDAIFSVPKALTSGSLALGATPWQTLVGVVLLTASPGIFSAVMIGLGRAVGETMIVLMATGNTAVMDFSMFSGFRTLSANIGVEMPEAGVGETHYRLLFLAALVLFAFTFVVNTAAEIVRQRLREKYQTI